jgi:hypothetical protein
VKHRQLLQPFAVSFSLPQYPTYRFTLLAGTLYHRKTTKSKFT